jgi:protein-S-isoprenylcysteine O-methyltransferase Ste14
MEENVSVEHGNSTVLVAINVGKALTVLLLILCAAMYGIQDFRQLLYLCLHGSYCLWWLLEQWFYPPRRQMFNQPTKLAGFASTLLLVGVFYTLPGYLAFTNSTPIAFGTAAIALLLYIFGSLINTSADVQKLTAKQWGADLVSDGLWRFSRHINYFGDWLRYLSFSVLAGSLLAYLVPGLILLMYLYLIGQKEQTMPSKYSGYAQYQQSTARFIPFIW